MSRLSEILGVEDGKYFTVENSERRFKLSYNKIHEYTSFGGLMIPPDIDTLIWLIENAEKIKIIPTKPKLTEQQVTAIKGRIAEGCKWLARDCDGDLWFYKLPPNYNSRFYTSEKGNYFNADNSLYKFVETGECIYLPDLIKEEEE